MRRIGTGPVVVAAFVTTATALLVLYLGRNDGRVGFWCGARARRQASLHGAARELVTAAFRRLPIVDELRKAQAEVTMIVDSITDAFFTLDREWRFTYLNHEDERLFRRSRDELLGKKIWDEFPEAAGTTYEQEYRSAMAEQRTAAFEEYYAPLGLWLDVRAYPSRDHLSVYYRDVTSRKRVERELRIRVRQLDSLATLGQRALAETDLDKLFEMTVQVVDEQLDVEYVELLELLPESDELLLHAGTGWREGLVGQVTISAGRASMAGYTLLSAEPVIVHDLRTETRFRGSPLLVDHGIVSGISVIILGRQRPWGVLGGYTTELREFSDDDIFFLQSVSNILGQAIALRQAVAERGRLLKGERKARSEADQRSDELERGTESRARLMRGFSHDVKNPLGAADGFLQLLEEGILDHLTEKQREGVAKARRAIGDALKLIEELLAFARAEAEEIRIGHVPIDPRATIMAVTEGYQAKAIAKRLSFTTKLPESLPTIESDADRIRQVLGNLLVNAVKYTEQGGITVTSAVREGGEGGEGGEGASPPGPGRWLAIDISDTGPGIPAEQREMIFNEFGRGTARDAEGSQGIGLSIALRIARALGGEITVRSEIGEGSTFTLWLPLGNAAE